MHWASCYNAILQDLNLFPKYQVELAYQGIYQGFFLIDTSIPQIVIEVTWMNLPPFKEWCIENKKQYLS
jgi:hypothetical protein